MQIEHVAGIRLATRRAAQQQRNLPIGPGLLGEIVVDDQRILAVIAEILAHGAAGSRARCTAAPPIPPPRRRPRWCAPSRRVSSSFAHHARDRRGLLADRDINALDVGAALVDDGVHGDGGLAGLAIADNQLALAAADGHHRVHRFETRLHRLGHGLAGNHARRDLLDRIGFLGLDRTLAVERTPERVHHAAEERLAYRHFEDAPGGLHRAALGDADVFAQRHGADRIPLQIEREAVHLVRELDHFAVLHVAESVDAHDAVGDGHHRADVALFRRGFEMFDALLDERGDFRRVELIHD